MKKKQKNKQKSISMEQYNKIMDRIIKMGLPVAESLILMLDEASKYRVKGKHN